MAFISHKAQSRALTVAQEEQAFHRGDAMMGAILVIFGVLGIARAISAKNYWAADVIVLHEFKQTLPT